MVCRKWSCDLRLSHPCIKMLVGVSMTVWYYVLQKEKKKKEREI